MDPGRSKKDLRRAARAQAKEMLGHHEDAPDWTVPSESGKADASMGGPHVAGFMELW